MDLELLILAATDRAGNGLFTVNSSMWLLIAEAPGYQQKGEGQSMPHGSLLSLPSAC